MIVAVGYAIWQRRNTNAFRPIADETPLSPEEQEDAALLKQAKSEGNRFITDVHL
jgi:hypothetical protein